MQRIYAFLIDAIDHLVMLPARKQITFLIFSAVILFFLLWYFMVNSSWQHYSLSKKQHEILIKQAQTKKPTAIIEAKAQQNMIGTPVFCDKSVKPIRKIGVIKMERKIITYYETAKHCLLKEIH